MWVNMVRESTFKKKGDNMNLNEASSQLWRARNTEIVSYVVAFKFTISINQYVCLEFKRL